MSDDAKKKDGDDEAPKVSIPSLLGDDVICGDVEPRDRDYYRWSEEEKRWTLIPCIDNLVCDLFLSAEQRTPTTRELGNVKVGLGATQRIAGLRDRCVIDYETRTAKSINGAIFASNVVVIPRTDGTVATIPYGRKVFTLTKLDYAYDPTATCPEIDKWLIDRLGDEEQVQAFWEFVGSCFRAGNQWKVFLALVGEGSTGKSCALNILRDVLGTENCSSLSAPYLNVPSVTPQVRGKLVNISEEKTGISASCEESVKDWTSGGPVNYNPKFRTAFCEPASAKLVFSMNRLPRFSDSSHAVYNRAIILLWNKAIALGDALTVEEIRRRFKPELPGALNRALAAKRALEQRGRALRPKISQEVAEDLYRESNPITAWFTEKCAFRPNGKTRVEDAYSDFQSWSVANGEKQMSRRDFGRGLRELGTINGVRIDIKVKRGRDGKDDKGREQWCNWYEGLKIEDPSFVADTVI